MLLQKLFAIGAVSLLKQNPNHSHSLINDLKELYSERASFALYSVKSIQGNRGRRGSSCSESNHSSIIIHLNDGVRSLNKYCEHPTTLFKDLLRRQEYHIKKWNNKLFEERES